MVAHGSKLWREVTELEGGKSQKMKQVGWHLIENNLNRELQALLCGNREVYFHAICSIACRFETICSAAKSLVFIRAYSYIRVFEEKYSYFTRIFVIYSYFCDLGHILRIVSCSSQLNRMATILQS